MGFCPDCCLEYLPDINVCLSCGAELIDEFPSKLKEEWIALPHVSNLMDAQAIKKALELMNIQCYLQLLWTSDRGLEMGSTSLKCAIAKVVVSESHYDEALVIQAIIIG